MRGQIASLGVEVGTERVVIDRNRISGGGVTAGIDFGLTIASILYGEEIAKITQLLLEYNPAPPFDTGSPEYSQEDVREILSIALAKHSTIDTELSDAQILEIAQDMNISPDAIERAQSQWLDRQKIIEKHQQFESYRRSKLQDRFGKYAIVNACLIPLNFLTGFGVPWSLYVTQVASYDRSSLKLRFVYTCDPEMRFIPDHLD